MKLANHLRLIPSATIDFKADKYYEESPPRDESRMTKFFKLVGAVKGDRQHVFCSALASDFRANNATIQVTDNKEICLSYGLAGEDFGEYSIQNVNEETEEVEEEDRQEERQQESQEGRQEDAQGDKQQETQEAYKKRISDAFQVPLLDMEKSLIGPEVINS